MKEKTFVQIRKVFIAALVLLAVFHSASAICDSAAEKYYYPNGTAIACPNINLPPQFYSEVMMLSLPLHFTFAMQDKVTTPATNPNQLGCAVPLFGYGYFDPIDIWSRTSLDEAACYLMQKNVYETITIVRNFYDWTAEYDAIVVVSDKNVVVPLNVGRNLTTKTSSANTFEGVCEDNSLCYTDALRITQG